jgi:hypothetical protein
LPQSVDEMLDINMLEYIPSEWHNLHTEEDWASLVLAGLDEFASEGSQYSTSSLQRQYIDEATRHRLYGAVFFPCKLLSSARREILTCLDAELPSYFVLAVNGHGLHFVARDGAMLAFCEYGNIVSWSGSYHEYKISFKKPDMMAVEDLLVTTKYADELSALLADYKEIHDLMIDP